LALLPASPKIFHGRDFELQDIIGTVLGDHARVAILGPGGMGKTTLAMAVLHDPAVVAKYDQRHFIPCDSASNGADLVSLVASYLGLEPSKLLSRAIVGHLTASGPTLILLLLDNFETPWEPLESRAEAEEFISLLTDIPTLALLITMRGAERPGKVKWSRPFLPVLKPLSKASAYQVFADIANAPGLEDQPVLDELLDLSGGLPLAVSLLASVASFEGYLDTLKRWNLEKTSLLSVGHDKHLNLEKSIMLSLGSPRLSSSPHTKELLSLLCLLPSGITEKELISSQVPIIHDQIAQSRTTLLRTTLVYIDVHGRLRALNPIREYIRATYPPPPVLYWPLVQHFRDLLELWNSHQDLSSGDLVPNLAGHIGNIRELLLQGPLPDTQSECLSVGHTIIRFHRFARLMLKRESGYSLAKRLPYLIEVTGDPQLRWSYACDYLWGFIPPIVPGDADCLMKDGLEYFATVQRPIEEGTYMCFRTKPTLSNDTTQS
ncbi:P-loop containing nucleoside triphosphate hydrolase protein, partial [Mycena filopes]